MKILIIDDEQPIRKLLSQLIILEGLNVVTANSGSEALQILELEEDIEVVISDVRLPDINGLELISKILIFNPFCEIIVLTAFGTIEDGVKAIKFGAFDYITKGDEESKIVPLVLRAVEKNKIAKRLFRLEEKNTIKYSFDNIIGSSSLIKEAVELAKIVSTSDTNVLLLGETGTGKDIFAQAIHYNSSRKNKPFVAVNCSSIAKDLLESEMFGYKAGAFTGANKNKKGLFEEADGGTLFLDEIAEMDVSLQSKLLRALENNSFIKTGDTSETIVDVRIIAATNKPISTSIKDGLFRKDLYYRIGVISIELPPLRMRKEDIKDLVNYFVDLYKNKLKRNIKAINDDFIETLILYSFPGNVRELKNIIERIILLNNNGIIDKSALPKEINNMVQEINISSLLLEDLEKEHIIKVLRLTGNNKTKTAELLGIGLTTLYRKLQTYGIE